MGTQLAAAPRFQGRTVNVALPVRPRPIGGEWQVWRTADGRAAIVADRVVEIIRQVERDESPRETGGILFGRGFRDGAGEYVLVTHAERPHLGEVLGTVSTVAITAEGASAMGRRALRAQPVADVVGWYHTHPSYAAYFSDVDRAEQRRWPSPLAVGLVMSGRDDAEPRYSVFIGPESASTTCPLFAPIAGHAGIRPEMEAREVAPRPDPSSWTAGPEQPPAASAIAARRRLVLGLGLAALVLIELVLIVWLILPSGSPSPTVVKRPGTGALPLRAPSTPLEGGGYYTSRPGPVWP